MKTNSNFIKINVIPQNQVCELSVKNHLGICYKTFDKADKANKLFYNGLT